MKRKMHVVIYVVVCFVVMGCSTFKDIVVTETLKRLTDSDVEYNQCGSLKVECKSHAYKEWKTSAGKTGCSCSEYR